MSQRCRPCRLPSIGRGRLLLLRCLTCYLRREPAWLPSRTRLPSLPGPESAAVKWEIFSGVSVHAVEAL